MPVCDYARRGISLTGLGDAWFECLALINLSRLNGELDPLELIARASALRSVAVEQALPAETEKTPTCAPWRPMKGCSRAAQLDICLERGALRLAQRYCQQSVDLAESLRGHQRYRLAFRLVKLLHILDRRERSEHADAVMDRLRRLCAESDDPRVRAATQQADGRRRLEKGDGSGRRRLRCPGGRMRCPRAHLDRGRRGRRARRLREPDPPPYDEAVDVALDNGRSRALSCWSARSRARSLLEALRGRLPRAGPGASAAAGRSSAYGRSSSGRASNSMRPRRRSRPPTVHSVCVALLSRSRISGPAGCAVEGACRHPSRPRGTAAGPCGLSK